MNYCYIRTKIILTMKKYFKIIIFLLIMQHVNAQKNDVVIAIHQETLNKMLTAVGEIKGTNSYEYALIKGNYHWFLQNPRIELIKDSAKFYTDAKVSVGPFKYTDKVIGKMSVKYDQAKNKIAIQLTDAVFEIYTTVLGKKISLKKIQIADYFTSPFLFDGPLNVESNMEFTMPDSTVKTIIAKASRCDIKILTQQIVVSTEMSFTSKEIIKPLIIENKQ